MQRIAHEMFKITQAICRARLPILTIAGVYALAIFVGVLMVHGGNSFALGYRDKLVGDAAKHDPAAMESHRGNNLRAALRDFAGNLIIGSVPKAIMGMAVILPYPWVAYQGWVGGIVSVRGDRSSRLNSPRPAVYYLLTLVLQIVPYSLSVGGGVNVGISLFRPAKPYQGEKVARIFPKEALRDLLRVYAAATPLFLVASLWEFLSHWNI
jgi:uncharacterized membrane protein SpoIIM required for sporulation